MKTPFYTILNKTQHAQKAKIRPYMQEIGLSIGQPKILNYLVEHDHASQKDLAIAGDIEAATVSKMLDTMEEKGLITRNRHQGDRRSFCVEITAKGREKQALWINHCHQVEDDEMSGFSEAERAQFSEYLCRMYKNLTGREIE